TIVAGGRRQAIGELEIELRQGEPGQLYHLAVKLHEDVPFTIESESKAARGYRLRSGKAPGAHKAPSVALQRKAAASEAFRQIVIPSLGHLVVNQPAGLARDPEGVHQMRVAVRRLRTALLVFKSRLEPHARARFEDALRRLGTIFGEARDWDVFCLEILP